MLVATTVIEVGVDVPNATVMVILDADRFGIAQLHQLRGPRRARPARFTLLARDAARPTKGNRRVEALVASNDGFELAEVDLELRGEGTLMSTAQKGRSDLKLASLRRDRELVELAREAAFEIVDADPDLSTSSAAARRARSAVHGRGRGLPDQVVATPDYRRCSCADRRRPTGSDRSSTSCIPTRRCRSITSIRTRCSSPRCCPRRPPTRRSTR